MAHQPRQKKKIWTNYWRGWNAMSGWQTSSLNNPIHQGWHCQPCEGCAEARIVWWSDQAFRWTGRCSRNNNGRGHVTCPSSWVAAFISAQCRQSIHSTIPEDLPIANCADLVGHTAPTVRLWGWALERVAAERKSLRYDIVPSNS